MKDEIKEILDEMEQICDVWVIMEGGVKTYNQDQIHCIYDYITNLQEELEEEKRIEQASLDTINNLQEENKRLEKINGVALTYNKHLMLCERQRHNLQHLKQMESILKGEGLE